MKPERQEVWDRIKVLALGLGLAGVEEGTSYGQPTLKAHGKLWVWWSPHEDAPVFKVGLDEREVLLEAMPEQFFITGHYRRSGLVLMRPDKLDLDWIALNLQKVWLAQAPKRLRSAMQSQKPPRPP